MKKSKENKGKRIVLVAISLLFPIYAYFALLFNHSLFQGYTWIMTLAFIIFFSVMLPIKVSKKISFTELSKILFGFFSFMLAAILFLFIQGTELIQKINIITKAEIDLSKLAVSVLILYASTLALFLFSYLSDNIDDKKLSFFCYRLLLGFMLLSLCSIISLFGYLISYLTYLPSI